MLISQRVFVITPTSSFDICGVETNSVQLSPENENPDMSVKDDLQLIYKPLLGMVFEATVHQIDFTMPQTENERIVLLIDADSTFAATLGGISKAVLKKHGKTVWKGITGPEEGFTDYWLWVEPTGLSEVVLEGLSYNFSIARCSPFECGSDTGFSYGVSIKANKMQ